MNINIKLNKYKNIEYCYSRLAIVDAVSMIEDGKAIVVFEKPEGLLAINQTSLPLRH